MSGEHTTNDDSGLSDHVLPQNLEQLHLELSELRRRNAGLLERERVLRAQISEYERTEQILQEYALAFENTSDGIIMCDPEGYILDWNPGAERTFGYARDEVLAQPVALLYEPRENEQTAPLVRAALARDGRWAGRRRIVRKNGSSGYCETIVVSLHDAEGRIQKNIGIHYDVTDRERAEKALKESEVRYRRLHEKARESLKVIRDDLQTARQVQQRILPSSELQLTGLEYGYSYQPRHRVGGDILDIAEIRPGVIRLMVADAIGHGVQASLVTMVIKTEYESLKNRITSPARLLEEMNHHLAARFAEMKIFFPAIVVDIMITRGKLKYASAGHPEQPVYHGTAGAISRLELTGPYLGMLDSVDMDEGECKFEQGDVLLLYTDGIPESMNAANEMFGEERMDEILRVRASQPMNQLIGAMLAAEETFRAGRFRMDDITLLAARRRAH